MTGTTRRLTRRDLDSATVTSAPEHAGPPGRPAPALVGGLVQARGTADSAAIVLGIAAVGGQIAYPLLTGPALRVVTAAAVLLFASASVVHAAAWLGPRAAVALVAGAAGLGLAAEAVGVATGLPFGRYAYAGTLGPQIIGVPLLVPLAWTMMAYPALLLARRLAGRIALPKGWVARAATAVLGGWTLAAWDLFLDPQMVAAGHWTWADPSPSLPGVPAVPIANTAGWLVVGTAMTALLDRLLPRAAVPLAAPPAAEALPAALLLWTWVGSVTANLAFFGRPWVALVGGAGMALVAVPYLSTLAQAARRGHSARTPR
jgi:uncharacterized membrane protein